PSGETAGASPTDAASPAGGAASGSLAGSTTRMGHTRWAPHGGPTDRNAHPHIDCTGRVAVIHNGIIENFAALREALTKAGHELRSDTDTEVVAHLLEDVYATTGGDHGQAMRQGGGQRGGGVTPGGGR